jgi:hypothetical protein
LSSLENAAAVIRHARARRGCMSRLESVHKVSGYWVYKKCKVEDGHGGVTNAGGKVSSPASERTTGAGTSFGEVPMVDFGIENF